MTSGVKTEISVYIHIPYCVSKCHYCDFNSYGTGRAPAPEAEYLRALRAELTEWPEILAGGKDWQAATIFFGGGTPSLFSADGIGKILEEVGRVLSIPKGIEITLEMNPKTADPQKMRDFQAAGVNRLSIGVQSLEEEVLDGLGRAHSARDALQTLDWAFETGWPRVSVDLMYGLPKQGVARVESTLRALDPYPLTHLSAYELIVEEGTPFYDRQLAGRLPLPEGDEVLAMRAAVRRFAAKKGMSAYEISNYAAPERRSEHNGHYWNYDSFLGVGAGAVSFLRSDELAPGFGAGERGAPEDIYGWRWTQTKDPEAYGKSRRVFAGIEREAIDRRGAMGEFMMMGLRREEGIAYAEFRRKFRREFPPPFARAVADASRRGLMESGPEGCRLTEEGSLLSNEIMQEFL